MPYSDPERQRAANAEHMRRRRATGVEPARVTTGPLLDEATRIRTAADVLGLLGDQMCAVLADEQLGTADRARVIATLAGVSLRAIEVAGLASRVEAIEDVLSDRKKASSR